MTASSSPAVSDQYVLPMVGMRLAHCSDLHLLSHDGARWLDLANKRWIGAMNLLSNRSRHYHVDAFDHMVEISGRRADDVAKRAQTAPA